MSLKNFVVRGQKTGHASASDWYYRAESAAALDHKLLQIAPSEGGFLSHSSEEVDELPDAAYATCPHCEERHLNEALVTTYGTPS